MVGDEGHERAVDRRGEAPRSASPATSRFHVLRSAVFVFLLFGLDKVLGLVRDVVVSSAFGASPELDAYYAAFELPDGLFTVVAGSALATSLIPVLSEHVTRKEGSVWELASSVLNLALIVVAVVSGVAALFAPQVIAVVAPAFDAYRAALATQLMRLVLLQTLISSASGIVMSVLQAHQHFLLPAAAPLAYTVGRIVGALFLAPHFGIFGLAIGGLAGTVGHFLVQVPGLIRFRARWVPTFFHPDLPKVLRLMGPRMLGLGATYLYFVLPTFLGSALPGGGISAYEYAWRLMQFPETLIGTAMGLTIFPTLAEHANAGDEEGLRESAGWALRMILTLTVPAAVGLLLLGRPFTVLLLQRGAFDSQDTARVVWALYFLSLGLVGHSALEVVSRVFYARRDMWTPLWAALAGLAVNGLLGWALLPSLAQGAIALGNSVGVCVQVAVLWLALRARVGGLEAGALSSSLTRTAMGTALMSVAVLGVRALVTGFLLDLFLALVVAVTVYVNAQLLLGNEELAELLNLVAQELRRWISLVRLKLVSDEGV